MAWRLPLGRPGPPGSRQDAPAWAPLARRPYAVVTETCTEFMLSLVAFRARRARRAPPMPSVRLEDTVAGHRRDRAAPGPRVSGSASAGIAAGGNEGSTRGMKEILNFLPQGKNRGVSWVGVIKKRGCEGVSAGLPRAWLTPAPREREAAGGSSRRVRTGAWPGAVPGSSVGRERSRFSR